MDDWDKLKAELLDDAETRRAYESRRPAYELASKLIEMRTGLGISQRQLASKARMTQPEIARIESGAVQPTWETISRVLGAVGAEVDIRVRDARGKLVKVSVVPGAPRDGTRRRPAEVAKTGTGRQ
ncbi:MAG: helix-turn-helix domain-containing protein [Chloroflexi bacterium]|nr:helix-turn-helix domain-containing protein [Chloroflexota bacterium]